MVAVKPKRVVLKQDCVIPFEPFTSTLGRAEFEVCVTWEQGKVKNAYVYPRQQEPPHINYCYAWYNVGSKEVGFISYGCMEEPNVWSGSWCKQHKTMSLSVYIPDGSVGLWLERLPTVFHFRFVGQIKDHMGPVLRPWEEK